jgi:hypothetical protein
MAVPYRIVVEPQEYDQYAAVIRPRRIIVTDFSNLGKGSIPARNFIWEHAISEGHRWHWILDDNICGFYRYNRNLKIPCDSGTVFRVAEDFVRRYANIGLAGFNYEFFAPQRQKIPPYYLNTRIYSCILIRNDLPFRWRGRYNEDTDLSLRVLKAGWCTVLFNAFLAKKMNTMSMKGGNTDQLYADDGRKQMMDSLIEQHPDVVTANWKWGRHQHQVDYSQFQAYTGNRLELREGLEIPDRVNNYGMVLQKLRDGEWVDLPQETGLLSGE